MFPELTINIDQGPEGFVTASTSHSRSNSVVAIKNPFGIYFYIIFFYFSELFSLILIV
jgi:hypothetical protein